MVPLSTKDPEQPWIMIVAGEPSGDAHAAGLVRRLRSLLPRAQFFGSGGRALAAEGVELLLEVTQLAAIGPRAALANLGSYVSLLRRLTAEVGRRRPALAVLVDFPDFNLRLARRLWERKIPVCYFISPQVWAWRESRVKQIRRYVDLMLVILPFEEGYFRERGVDARYVGNPTASRLRETMADRTRREDSSEPIVALLPGSRKREVSLILPVQLDAAAALASRMPVRFWLIRAPEISPELIEALLAAGRNRHGSLPAVEVRDEPADFLLPQADAAVVKSGTSTLEAMLAGVPFAMVYRLAFSSWLLLRPLVRPQIYCLANLVAGERIVPEFIQGQARGGDVADFLETVLKDRSESERIRRRLAAGAERLGRQDAYDEAARSIVQKFFKDVEVES
ncbi:MAG: lipid-A-disaccharide synthase [Acidobacteriota bacterium]